MVRQWTYRREHARQEFLIKVPAVKHGKQPPCSLSFIGASGDHAPSL
jgi:hypothetical protein